MARRCAVTGKGVMFGNNVSHANNKSRRRFNPNLQEVGMYSDALGSMVRLRISTSALRTIEVKGGIDSFLMDARDDALSQDTRRLKKRIARVLERKAAAESAA